MFVINCWVWQIITTKLPGWDDVGGMKSKPNDVERLIFMLMALVGKVLLIQCQR